MKKGVLRNFTKFSFFNKVVGLSLNFIKRETLAQIFSCEFCEISENIFFTEHLRATASFFHVSNGSKKHLEFKIMTLVNFFFMVIVLM